MPTTLIIAPAVEPVTLAEAKLHLRVDHSDEDALISSLISAARRYAETFTGRQIITATWELTLDAFPWIIEPPHPLLQSITSIVYVDVDGVSQTLDASIYQVDITSTPGRVKPAFGEVWPGTRSQFNAVTVTYVAGYGTVQATAVTVDAGTEVWTATAHGMSTGSAMELSTSTTLPAGTSLNTTYYVNVATVDTFKIYPSRADAFAETNNVEVSDTGSGTHTVTAMDVPDGLLAAIKLMIGGWYEHREDATEANLKKAPRAVDTLLWQHRIE